MLAVVSQHAWSEDLLGVYQLALERDAQLRAAAATRDAEYETKALARSQLLPNINLGANAYYLDQDIKDSIAGSGQRDFDASDVSVGLVQPIFRRDRLVQLDQADWVLEQADANYRVVEQGLISRVTTAYFDVLAAQDNLEFVRAEKKAIERQLDQAKQRFEVGLIAITGVHEAQARFDQARTNEIVALNELDAAWEALREIIGISPQELAKLKEDIPLEPPVPANVDEWSSMALENNPSVQSASHATQISQREIDVQQSGHYPTLDLVGSYAMDRSGSDVGTDVDTASIGLQFNVPLYAGGGITAATRQARYQLTASQEVLDQTRRQVDKNVRNAYRTVHASISAVRSLKAQTVSAESALEATTAGFDVGTRTLVDVLNGQSDFFQAQRDYTNARYVYILSGLALKLSAGTLTEQDLVQVNELLD